MANKPLIFTRPTDAALYAYDTLKLRIFPIQPNGKRDSKTGGLIDKTPAFGGWRKWSVTANLKKVGDFGKANPTHNWGLHTGNSQILVLDIDKKNNKDGFKTLNALIGKHGKLPNTLTVQTPSKGLHIYLRCKADLTGGTNKLGEGLDVQCGGKYVVLFGSMIEHGVTKDGKPQVGGSYAVDKNYPIADAPEWLIKEIIDNTNKVEAVQVEDITNLDTPENIEKAIDYLRSAPACVEGSETGGEYLLQIFYFLRDFGISKGNARELVLEHYNDRCEPPWDLSTDADKKHFEAKLRNAYKYAQNSVGSKTDEAAYLSAVEDFKPLNIEENGPIQLKDFKGEPPKRLWLFPDWLPLGEVSSLYGAGGAGKSLLSLQIANAVAGGQPFVGMEPEHTMPVLCVYCEDSEDEIHRRIHSIRNAPEYEFLQNSPDIPLFLWARVGMANDLARLSRTGNDVVPGPFREILENQLKKMPEGNKLLILDTLSDIYLGDENVREKVTKFIKTHLGSLAKDHDLTILFLAHPSRAGKNIGDLLSGSTAWENAVRNRLAFYPHKKFKDVMVLKRMKSNYAKTGEEILLQWEQGRFRTSDLAEVAKDSMSEEQKDLLNLIAGYMRGESMVLMRKIAQQIRKDEAAAHLFGGKSIRTIDRHIIELLQYPKEHEGLCYSYYEEGEKRVNRYVVSEPCKVEKPKKGLKSDEAKHHEASLSFGEFRAEEHHEASWSGDIKDLLT